MILDNTNYNQKMYFVSTSSKALCTRYLLLKNENHFILLVYSMCYLHILYTSIVKTVFKGNKLDSRSILLFDSLALLQ